MNSIFPSHSRTTVSVSNVNQSARRESDIENRRNRRKPRKSKNNYISGVLKANDSNVTLGRDERSSYTLSMPSTSRGIEIQQVEIVQHARQSIGEQEDDFKYNFVRVEYERSGAPIRKRSSRNKYISLKSFVPVTLVRKPCVFTTDLSISKLVGNLEKLTVSTNSTTKTESRKHLKGRPRKKRDKKDSTSKESETEPFPDYLTADEASEGLVNGALIKGFVRINPKNYRDSYVSNEDTSLADYYLTSVLDRNRALDGDEVLLEIKPESEWLSGKKTARVVFIKQKVHPRILVGSLKPADKKNSDYAVLIPRDKRCPVLRIPAINLPNGYKDNPKLFKQILFVARISNWDVPAFAQGILTENLGVSGDLRVETLSILRECCLDVTPFSEELKEYLPKSKEIPEEELKYREDLRKECIFTIDPATARDLDDAVSAKRLPNGNLEIGVHISDASFYLSEGTELDQMVSKKATSIYLVDTVYHMLPVELCLHCSLLPQEDKLAFSVIWEMTPDAEIINKRFRRTVVNSCVKLSYEHAQLIIDDPDRDFEDDFFPPVHNGFGVRDLMSTVTLLQSVAVKLREKRVRNGALKINQVKLLFTLHPSTGEPRDFAKYENNESHRLIEEFMLLANISVAEKISESFPELAFLRRHAPPKQTMLVELKNGLASYGIHMDVSSSGGINSSLKKYVTDDYAGQCREVVLNHLTAKAMTRAQYFCASTVESELDYKHYALSVPIYTHFTSPIRRYADIMVHRLLAASLDYCDPPEWDVDYVCAIATRCNAQKYNAKKAGDASIELYLADYIDKHKPFEQDCVVVDVKDRSFDAIALKTGSLVRIYNNNCEEGTTWKTETIPLPKAEREADESPSTTENEKKQLKLIITFPKTRNFPATVLTVEIFTIVKVNLERKQNSYKLEGVLVRPLQPMVFRRNR